MAIRSSIYFIFDSQLSTSFGISNVNISTGLLEEPFMATRQVNEVKIKGRDKPYFGIVTHDTLSFTLTLAFNDTFDSDKLRAVARWLSVESYKPLQFSDNLDKVYFAQLDSDSKITHNGAGNGYISVTMKCNSPYATSPVFLSPTFDLTSNPVGGTIISLNNMGDISTLPEVYIDKVGLGDFEIINLSNSGASFKFTNAIANPTVAPVMTQIINAGSTLPAGTYYGRYTYAGTTGETLVSPETSFVLSSGYSLVMTIPTLETNAGLANIYIGNSAGTGKLQGNSITTTFTLSIPLISVVSAPTSNTSGIRNGENLYIDNENELVISDQSGVYRYTSFNNGFLELIYGQNQLLIKGTGLLRFRYFFKYLQG